MSASDILGDRLEAARTDPFTGSNPFQLALQGLMFPTAAHWAFNIAAGAALALAGAPRIAAASVVASCLIDLAQQTLYRRWSARAELIDEAAGFRRLSVSAAIRSMVYLAGPTYVAIVHDDGAAFALLGVVCCSVLALAQAYGAFSRAVFWGMAAPALLALAVSAAASLPVMPLLGVILSLAALTTTLLSISFLTTRNLVLWRSTHLARISLIDDLAAAHDRAVQARAAADEAHEAARRAAQAKSAFLATMSHEIRTPMNGVLGMAELLRREEREPVQLARLETLIRSGEHLMSILDDILDYSKVDAGRIEISPRVEDLTAFLDQAVDFWTPKAVEKGLELRLDAQPGLPSHLLMDGLRVRQIVYNLMGNALKFTETGSVTLRAAALTGDGSQALLTLSVLDTGPGVDPQDIPVLFDRFSQGERGRHIQAGAGLGLAICKQLTSLMGGRIWAENRPDGGAALHVELPLALAAPGEAAPARAEPAAEGELRPLCVLAVDDNPVNLTVIEQLLCAFGHEVVRAASGPEALEALAAQSFDLVLMDIQMPGMSGIETVAAMRASGQSWARLPVIALTADVISGGAEHYRTLGFDGHAAKPIRIAELAQAIEALTTPPPADELAQSA